MSGRKSNALTKEEFSLSDVDRFNSKIIKAKSGCWDFLSGIDRCGYRRFSKSNIRSMPAHRASFAIHYGLIPDNVLVCHKCDNPSCVNPEHLFLGTDKDNNQDKINKGRERGPTLENRQKTHCKSGHEFTMENTYTRNRPGGGRICKTCIYERSGLKCKNYGFIKKKALSSFQNKAVTTASSLIPGAERPEPLLSV